MIREENAEYYGNYPNQSNAIQVGGHPLDSFQDPREPSINAKMVRIIKQVQQSQAADTYQTSFCLLT